jgi:predicted transcriptional regulator
MRTEQVNYLSDEEYELVTILRELGFKKTTACVLVYLANVREASSRDIERGTDIRQPEVSLAIKEMDARGWIAKREQDTPGRGRRIKLFRLTKPFARIAADIDNEKRKEAENVLVLVRKMQDQVSG